MVQQRNKKFIGLSKKTQYTECPILKGHYFEAVYKGEFSIHFFGSYRKLKPKDAQIDW